MKREQQYQALHQAYADRQPAQPGLAELCALWKCSERNARLQLAKMRARGWLSWEPGRGRGRKSRLSLLCPPEQLEWQRLQRLLRDGKLEQAFAQLPPQRREQLLSALPQYLGSAAQGRCLRIPIPHAPLSLDPVTVSGRLESHLVRQIFDRLCRFDRALQSLQSGLAHHWESDAEARRWRFWLRPGLQFHDGAPLQADAAAASLLRLRESENPYQRQYRHLSAVEVHDALSFSCRLDDGDFLWPQRLATANSSIVPLRRNADFDRLPVGSGPFRALRHSEQRLSLAAFAGHYRERALLDEIELWFIPSGDDGQDFHLRLDYANDDANGTLQSACTYLLLNPALPDSERAPLMRWLAEPALVLANDALQTPAQGLLPGWRHPLPQAERRPRLNHTRLRLFHYDLPCFPPLAAAIRQRLAGLAIELEIHALSRRAFFHDQDWWRQADLMLCSEVLHDDRDYSCHEWLGTRQPLQRGLSAEAQARLNAQLRDIQRQADTRRRMAGYAAIGDWLCAEGWVLPLSHERQGHQASPQLAGLQMSENGWTDFAGLWLRPVQSDWPA
ncbi:hypothetical protein B0T40_07060 [Chromobacterium haemolyticum]|uniref:SgrR family transcriptional regulator n=1 Tax=Chromobacterium haemolyticum TaxID=394935 RepID=UPI0009DB28D4|nr:SgrR family transcriptional regulator [Chromobacterium haemolyticum]OQS37875.1 hypothetical protein B0T40_07060 [Chromobacterium haemolyticum]